ncbi:MAG: DUF2330 domain-containing protein [Deltaproteobacteria bacterium]|nr:DUF2330 domain-containing protein [Deltaproteobacteria bacterium]
MTSRWGTLIAMGAGAAAFAMVAPERADACGGFFCNAQQPVIQTGEAIIFAVDRPSQTVEATINISYQGAAQDFAWILPLQAAPTSIELGSSFAFQTMQQLTLPRFQITEVEETGICGPSARFASDSAAGTNFPAAPNEEKDPGVQVLKQAQVGPYDTVVLSGKTAEDIRQWLVGNDYNVTDAMMQQVVPYVAQGDVLMALKLRKDQSTGDIQPIKLVMPGDQACVPLRLTAIAAQDDMQVLVGVLSNEGRAIPENYFHVTPNLARIDWLRGGANYSQLIADAVDEGEGNAFTTEFSGSARIFDQQIFVAGRIDTQALASAPKIDDFLRLAIQMGLSSRSELAGILSRAISDEALAAAGLDRTTFNNCIPCFIGNFGSATLDAVAASAEIEERIVAPERKAQATFDRFGHFTRLNTFISPEEMGVDPDFVFNASLPDVSNVHGAKMILDCGVGGSPGSAGVHVILEDGTTISFDSNGNPDRTLLDSMPAAVKVEQLAQGLLVRDNSRTIEQQLDEHNGRNGAGCGCASSDARRSLVSSAALIALLGAAILLRRRR